MRGFIAESSLPFGNGRIPFPTLLVSVLVSAGVRSQHGSRLDAILQWRIAIPDDRMILIEDHGF